MHDLENIDHVRSHVPSFTTEALLDVFEVTEAMNKLLNKGRSPTMTRVSVLRRVDFD